MKVGNLKYLAFEMGRWFESHYWLTYPNYDSHNRRFEIIFGNFGKRCDITLYLMLEHALNTWINHDITIRLVLVDIPQTQAREDVPNEVCLYSRLCHIGDILDDNDMNELLSFMEFIRDCPNEVNRFVRCNKSKNEDEYGLEWMLERKAEWTKRISKQAELTETKKEQ